MAAGPSPGRPTLRTPLKTVRGLGAAHAGVGHWQAERLSGLALVPLTVWFVVSVLGLLGADQPTVAAWAARPWHAAMLLALVGLTFQHGMLGLQVVFEDYIHDRRRLTAALLLMRATGWLAGLMGGIAVLKLATH